jgi:hypothetical protein
MMSREEVVQTVRSLGDAELEQLAQYLAFIRFQSRIKPAPQVDESELAELYREFGTEDRELAEEGVSDYAEALAREDVG